MTHKALGLHPEQTLVLNHIYFGK